MRGFRIIALLVGISLQSESLRSQDSYGIEAGRNFRHLTLNDRREKDDPADSSKVDLDLPKWYIGFGIGSTTSLHKFKEPSPIPSGGKTGRSRSLHLEVLYAINEDWLLESGISAIPIVPPDYISTAASWQPEVGMLMIPIRINYAFHLAKEVDLMLFAGYSQGIKTEQVVFGLSSQAINAYGDYYGNGLFPMADIGTKLKFSLGRIHLGAVATYSQGFTDIYSIYVTDMPNVTGGYPELITSNGSNFNIRLSAYYAIKGKSRR